MTPQTAEMSIPMTGAVSSQGQSSDGVFSHYDRESFFDEMFDNDLRPHAWCTPLHERLCQLPPEELRRRQQAAARSMVRLGITFNVYGDAAGTERIIPFDIIPR